MTLLKVKDRDGQAVLFFAPDGVDLKPLADQVRAKADKLKCNMREIPILGQPAKVKYHPSFRVTVADGVVTGVAEVTR